MTKHICSYLQAPAAAMSSTSYPIRCRRSASSALTFTSRLSVLRRPAAAQAGALTPGTRHGTCTGTSTRTYCTCGSACPAQAVSIRPVDKTANPQGRLVDKFPKQQGLVDEHRVNRFAFFLLFVNQPAPTRNSFWNILLPAMSFTGPAPCR